MLGHPVQNVCLKSASLHALIYTKPNACTYIHIHTFVCVQKMCTCTRTRLAFALPGPRSHPFTSIPLHTHSRQGQEDQRHHQVQASSVQVLVHPQDGWPHQGPEDLRLLPSRFGEGWLPCPELSTRTPSRWFKTRKLLQGCSSIDCHSLTHPSPPHFSSSQIPLCPCLCLFISSQWRYVCPVLVMASHDRQACLPHAHHCTVVYCIVLYGTLLNFTLLCVCARVCCLSAARLLCVRLILSYTSVLSFPVAALLPPSRHLLPACVCMCITTHAQTRNHFFLSLQWGGSRGACSAVCERVSVCACNWKDSV